MRSKQLGPETTAGGRRPRLGPRSNLVLTQDQDARVKALVVASARLMGEPMPPTQILRAAVSIGLVTLEQRFGLEPMAAPAPAAAAEHDHYAPAPRHRVSGSTRR